MVERWSGGVTKLHFNRRPLMNFVLINQIIKSISMPSQDEMLHYEVRAHGNPAVDHRIHCPFDGTDQDRILCSIEANTYIPSSRGKQAFTLADDHVWAVLKADHRMGQ